MRTAPAAMATTPAWGREPRPAPPGCCAGPPTNPRPAALPHGTHPPKPPRDPCWEAVRRADRKSCRPAGCTSRPAKVPALRAARGNGSEVLQRARRHGHDGTPADRGAATLPTRWHAGQTVQQQRDPVKYAYGAAGSPAPKCAVPRAKFYEPRRRAVPSRSARPLRRSPSTRSHTRQIRWPGGVSRDHGPPRKPRQRKYLDPPRPSRGTRATACRHRSGGAPVRHEDARGRSRHLSLALGAAVRRPAAEGAIWA